MNFARAVYQAPAYATLAMVPGSGQATSHRRKGPVDLVGPSHVGQVFNLPYVRQLRNVNYLSFVSYVIGRLKTCPTTKSTGPKVGGDGLMALAP